MLNPELRGSPRERNQQPRPRKLLPLDGGGFRGTLTLQIPEPIANLLATACGAGPGTGAIIAACLAGGMPVAQLTGLYRSDSPVAGLQHFGLFVP